MLETKCIHFMYNMYEFLMIWILNIYVARNIIIETCNAWLPVITHSAATVCTLTYKNKCKFSKLTQLWLQKSLELMKGPTIFVLVKMKNSLILAKSCEFSLYIPTSFTAFETYVYSIVCKIAKQGPRIFLLSFWEPTLQFSMPPSIHYMLILWWVLSDEFVRHAW